MEIAFECLPCTLQSCCRLLNENEVPAPEQERLIRETLRFLADADWTQSPPALARDLHALLRHHMHDPDPYR